MCEQQHAASHPLDARIRSGDHDALADLIADQHDRLVRFVRSLMSDKLIAVVEPEDVVQEVSAAAIRSLSSAPLDRYAPIQWLQELARRRVVDAHRHHFGAARRDAGRQQSMHGAGEEAGFEAFLAASITSPSAAFSRDVRVNRMHQAIAELGDEARQAVQMRYAEGLPTKEIAQRLGKTDVAVRVLLSRSVRTLEKELEDVRPSDRGA